MIAAAGTTEQAVAEFAPQPVLCVTEHLGRDLGVADQARNGRFRHHGTTLALGRCPDWLAQPTSDLEWRLEWVKLYEGLDLAYAYGQTGDTEYLDTWQDLVSSFCGQVPIGHDTSDVTARRLLNWLYAWQGFATSNGYRGLRSGLAERLRRRMGADAGHVSAHLTPERNHRTLELYAVLLIELAIIGDRPGAARVLDRLAENAAADIRADGVHREASTDYHHIVLRSFVGAIANARRFGLTVPKMLLRPVGLAADFALHVQRPDGFTPATSDGDRGDFRALLTLADVLDRPELRWAASAGTDGQTPMARSVSFPVGGYYVQRSGWGDRDRAYADERFALVDCGPIGDGGHGHYDQLSVELYAAGQPLVVDPGRYTYDAADGDWRRAFKGTAAHNTVCVDRQDQIPFRPGKPKGPLSTARLLGRVTRPGLDVLRGEVRSPAYDTVHTRTVALVGDDYWVVHDRLRGSAPHRFQVRWHLDAGQTVQRHEAGGLTARGLTILVPSGDGGVGVEPGWVSHAYGIKHPAPVVTVTTEQRADADLVTVLLPEGDVDAQASAIHTASRTEIEVRRAGRVDRLRWRPEALLVDWKRTSC